MVMKVDKLWNLTWCRKVHFYFFNHL